MPKEPKEVRELKKLIDAEMQEAIEQYQKANLQWICSNASEKEIDRKKRALFTDYEDSFQKLHDKLFMKKGVFKMPDETVKEYLKENDMLYMMEDYAHMVIDRGSATKEEQLAKHQEVSRFVDPESKYNKEERSQKDDPLEKPDVVLTEDQKNGLKSFHKWLHRNCDKVGAAFLNTNGSMRNLADKFMSQPASVQLKTLYLLESQTRKNPDKNAVNEALEKHYAPNLENLKDQMIASKWKFWKRTNGGQFYWHRLKESLDVANELDSPELEEQGPEKGQEPEEKKGPVLGGENGQVNGSAKEQVEDPSKAPENEEQKESFLDKADDVISTASDAIDTNIMGRLKDPHDAIADMVEIKHDLTYTGSAATGMQIAGAAGAGLRALVGVASVVMGIRNMAKASGTARAIDQTAQGIGLVSDTSFAASGAADTAGNIFKLLGASAETVGNVSSILTGAAGSAMFIQGTLDLASNIRQNQHAKNAEAIADKFQDKELKNLAEFSQTKFTSKTLLSVGKMTQGAAWATAGFVGAFAAGAAGGFLAPAMTLAAVGVGIAAQAYEAHVKQNMYRDTIDHDLKQNGMDIDTLDKNLQKTLDNRRKRFKEGSKERKKLDQMLDKDSEKQRKDIIRREKAAEKNYLTMEEYHQRVIDSIGDKIYEKCYKDKDHVITQEEKDIYFDKTKTDKETQIRIGYKELQKSLGIKMDLPTRKSIAKGEKPEAKREKLKEGLSM